MAMMELDGTRSWLDRLWSSIADRGRAYVSGPDPAVVSAQDRVRWLAEALVSERGEASGAAVARDLQEAVRALSSEDRLSFYRFLAENFGPEPERLRRAAEAWLAEPTSEHAVRLADAAEPPRQELLRRMNMSPGGTAALIALRRELLGLLREHPELKPLESDLRHLLGSWFNRGFLELHRIDWQTPAAVLEKLIAYEAVHEIQGWEDLRRRLAADRRCFGFFHPALPGEPLIFVQVALTEGLASAIQPLLARDGDEAAHAAQAARADTAIFYSISNCQDGLRGISFGNFLIKQVVEELKAELPELMRFATLSPVPGFRRWLEPKLAAGELPFREEERAALLAANGGGEDAATAIAALLGRERWWEDQAVVAALRGPLMRLSAEYLTAANDSRGPADPVARFHLGNGARLERVNWLGNLSPRAMRESFGLMVNYLYDREAIEANHEAFAHGGRVVRSPEVEALLRGPSGSLLSRIRPREGAPAR
ncbi:MAG TPA: malonyl-CoA decarboxylase [Crenalkalicoccus sp.]|nr:malonyl-CoA decarboxylase [Crenalkalicoccus sp.]